MTDDLEAIGGLGLQGAGVLGLYWAIGPAVYAFGRNFGAWTDYQTQNLFKLGAKAEKRLGGKDPADGESVHPRVAKEILFEASWISDDVHQEYLAGVLIGARSLGGRSERGIQAVRTLAGMTSNQIRLHHAIYRAFIDSGRSADELGAHETRHAAALWAPISGLDGIVVPEPGERTISAVIESALALEQLLLLDTQMIGDKEQFSGDHAVPEATIFAHLEPRGIELLFSAYGITPSVGAPEAAISAMTPIGPTLDKSQFKAFLEPLTLYRTP